MGKFAKVLGMGAKGQLRLELDCQSYHPGDTIQGTVFFVVKEAIRCNGALVLGISGLEALEWEESTGEDRSFRSKKQALLNREMDLTVNSDSYTPGEYSYPFAYRLPPVIPASFSIANRPEKNVKAQIKYEIQVCQPVRGALTSDLVVKQELVVLPTPIARFDKPVQYSVEKEVRMLTIVRKGICQISAFLNRDAYAVGEEITVRCSVFNRSKMKMRWLSIELHEDLHVHEGKNGFKISTRLCQQQYAITIPAGQSRDHTVAMRLVSNKAFYPTNTTPLVSWKYHVRVHCGYLFSRGAWLAFPVTVVPAEAPHAQTAMKETS